LVLQEQLKDQICGILQAIPLGTPVLTTCLALQLPNQICSHVYFSYRGEFLHDNNALGSTDRSLCRLEATGTCGIELPQFSTLAVSYRNRSSSPSITSWIPTP